jgi:integrase
MCGKKRDVKKKSSTHDPIEGQKMLSQPEVKMLLESIEDMRDKLCVSILYETGCLLGELVNIKVSDVSSTSISIVNSETGAPRHALISPALAERVHLFIRGNGLSKSHYLFSTKKSEQISVKRVRELVQYYSDKAGFGKLNPQSFRYYHIAHAYLNGVFSESISSQLGITRFRVFQILEALNVSSGENKYGVFLAEVKHGKQ